MPQISVEATRSSFGNTFFFVCANLAFKIKVLIGLVSALSLITLQGSSFSAMLSLFDARVCTTLNSSAIHTTPASLGVSGVLLPRHESFFFRSSSARATFTLPAWKGTNPGLALHNTTSSMFALKQINNPLPHFCRTNTSQEGLKVQPFCRKALKIPI